MQEFSARTSLHASLTFDLSLSRITGHNHMLFGSLVLLISNISNQKNMQTHCSRLFCSVNLDLHIHTAEVQHVYTCIYKACELLE